MFFLGETVKMPMMDLPSRCTIVRISLNRLIVITPTKNMSDFKVEIDALGEVVALVEPNLFHNLFSQQAKELYPNALFSENMIG
jgi:hypothetical protein